MGNQNVQWGRGIGANPTNNISPSNGFFLTANGNDQKMYNFMLKTKVYINPNLEWEVIAIPIYKMDVVRLDLLNIPVATIDDSLPEKKFKNGSFATKLNLNGGPDGASLSYYNGYSTSPGVNTGYDQEVGPYAFNQPYKMQVFGGDFMHRFAGKSDGKDADPSNELLISAEAAYSKIENNDDEGFIPQSNLEFSAGFIKQFWNSTKLDNFTLIMAYKGKYTPNFEIAASDDTEKLLSQQLFGQFKGYVQGVTGIFTKTWMNQKLKLTLVTNYVITPQPDGDSTGHSFLIYPQANWEINDDLIASGGYFNLDGAGSNVAGPLLNGAFLGLKYRLKIK
ncbi:hypothetical protein NBRC110019_12350 [Neptunitalea chrysea]|uniref:Uncharacterized protein n=1 Tax=Neptunitalea chrysea TaxID=1647581 RepID=A0A9W6B456_9FLAO|nr:hypothetical protein [Neptunitalea chrysea]GLB52196.1 hypothetical protein NBRC110019_12350 [Neptunitalea chrysea]